VPVLPDLSPPERDTQAESRAPNLRDDTETQP
jgi:hypothetical protein